MAATASFTELKEDYDAFLREERYNHVDRIATAIDDFAHTSKGRTVAGWGCPRVEISMSELRSRDNGQLSQRLRMDPLRHMRALEAACHGIALEERPGYDKEGTNIKVALSGPVGASPSSPRELTASSLRQLVCVEGVATKVSAIKPKVVRSVHYCASTKQHSSREYIDATDPQLGLRQVDNDGREMDRIINITESVYPTKDKDGNPLETEFGLSQYKDHQTITLQEMPERAPMGQLPRSVELILDHDLVDRIKPGDRVMVVGVYRALATAANQSTSGVFRTVVLINNIQILGRDTSRLTFSPQDVRMIKSLGERNDILQVLGRSLSPSIHGHTVIKKALVLQLLSGCEKNLKNGTHLRGDINILMVGDPSTAKSQLLRSAMMIAPLAVSTTGKGSSGVGLTAAVTSDPETRERRLEAGAMVLADRGLVCVDEFDKMGENDRVAIHEAMEQQTVTIAKAGIHASLNARCSVLAAANPVYGQYDRSKRVQENIGLPDSLLSRFDLLFIVLDQVDPETDRLIANHVIRSHQYRPEHGNAGHDSDYDDDDSDDEFDGGAERVQSVWQRGRMPIEEEEAGDNSDHAQDILQHDFLRKYLHFAKRLQPELTDEATEYIANQYAEMRCRQDERTLPVTARTLETVIRLATAHAKIRLSSTVEAIPDCVTAMGILSFALYHENRSEQTPPPELKRPVEISDEGEPSEPDAEEAASAKRQKTSNNEALQSRIWKQIVESEGSAEMVSLCVDINERTTVEDAVDVLVEQGKLMLSEGTVYQC